MSRIKLPVRVEDYGGAFQRLVDASGRSLDLVEVALALSAAPLTRAERAVVRTGRTLAAFLILPRTAWRAHLAACDRLDRERDARQTATLVAIRRLLADSSDALWKLRQSKGGDVHDTPQDSALRSGLYFVDCIVHDTDDEVLELLEEYRFGLEDREAKRALLKETP